MIWLLTLGGLAVTGAGAWAMLGDRPLVGMSAIFAGAVLVGIGIGARRQERDGGRGR